MREVASFMHMYPAYTVEGVLNEYAIRFFAMLNEGYRLKYDNARLLAQIADLPHMEQEDRNKFYKNLEWASMHPADILNSSGSGSSSADIKKLLG